MEALAQVAWDALDEHITVQIFSFLQRSKGKGFGYSQLEVARLQGGAQASPVPESVARRRRRLAAAKWTAGCREVCARWSRLAADDALWQPLCVDAFRVEMPPSGADGAAQSAQAVLTKAVRYTGVDSQPENFFGVWCCWQAAEKQRGGLEISAPHFTAASAAFETIGSFSDQVAQSLRQPLEAAEWEAFESKLREGEDGLPEQEEFSHAEQEEFGGLLMLKMLLAAHNGQSTKCDEDVESSGRLSRDDEDGRFAGMFGGYSAYDHMVCTRLFSLSRVMNWSARLCSNQDVARTLKGKELVIAADFKLDKLFTLNVHTGAVSFLLMARGVQLIPAHPSGGNLLTWIGNFATSLENRTYRLGPIVPDRPSTVGFAVYNHANMTSVVTRGVRAEAVAVWAPERNSHIYSVRLKLLSPDEEGGLSEEQRGFSTCQLQSRHWAMRMSDGSIDSVDGSGVVGKYPVRILCTDAIASVIPPHSCLHLWLSRVRMLRWLTQRALDCRCSEKAEATVTMSKINVVA